MADTPESLRWRATQYDRQANDARIVADRLAGRYDGLERRLHTALRLHTASTWTSQAATASRRRLQISGTGSLGRARDDLLAAIGSLRARVVELEDDAAWLRRQAVQLEAAQAVTVPDLGTPIVGSPYPHIN